MYEEEFLEIFGGDIEMHDLVKKTVQEKIYNNEACKHINMKVFVDGRGYCKDCGMDKKEIDVLAKGLTRCATTSSTHGTKRMCLHENSFEDNNGLHICRDCNLEIDIPSFEAEWRYYNSSDCTQSKDPSRCHRNRNQDCNIIKDFEKKQIHVPESVRKQVEVKYQKIVGNQTVRGKCRQAIIAACLFYAYQDFGEYRTTDYIRNKFDLSKKNMSTGLTRYYEVFEEDRNRNIRSEDLLVWILTLTGVEKKYYKEIVQISRYLENSSQLLKRSSPQSIAAAVIYFYLCLNPEYKARLGLTKNRFAEKALLSDITITKLVNEACAISKCIGVSV
jgi:transcription initiation factor TFIIIB Brf1 subunit/transcription initiation factor TFIIB